MGHALLRVISIGLLVAAAMGMRAPAGFGAGQQAADFVGGGAWFNTGGKVLSIRDLRGKVVAVEMWTAG